MQTRAQAGLQKNNDAFALQQILGRTVMGQISDTKRTYFVRHPVAAYHIGGNFIS